MIYQTLSKKVSPQYHTTIQWKNNGELSPIEIAKVLDELHRAELTEYDLGFNLNDYETHLYPPKYIHTNTDCPFYLGTGY